MRQCLKYPFSQNIFNNLHPLHPIKGTSLEGLILHCILQTPFIAPQTKISIQTNHHEPVRLPIYFRLHFSVVSSQTRFSWNTVKLEIYRISCA